MSGVNSIIEVAKSYLGTAEGSAQHKEIIDLYNKARYADAYQMTMNDPWCCAFVVACFKACDMAGIIPGYAACDQMIHVFKQWNKFQSGKAYTPQKGDIIFYDWNGDGSSDHVGIVVSVGFGELAAIEGNKSDTVGYRKLAITSSQIVGYGKPNYGAGVDGSSEGNRETGGVSAIDREYIRTLPLLQRGCKSVYVKVLQVLMNYYEDAKLDVDGDFGNLTKNAVSAYQKKFNLEVDGVVGHETWTHLLVLR